MASSGRPSLESPPCENCENCEDCYRRVILSTTDVVISRSWLARLESLGQEGRRGTGDVNVQHGPWMTLRFPSVRMMYVVQWLMNTTTRGLRWVQHDGSWLAPPVRSLDKQYRVYGVPTVVVTADEGWSERPAGVRLPSFRFAVPVQ